MAAIAASLQCLKVFSKVPSAQTQLLFYLREVWLPASLPLFNNKISSRAGCERCGTSFSHYLEKYPVGIIRDLMGAEALPFWPAALRLVLPSASPKTQTRANGNNLLTLFYQPQKTKHPLLKEVRVARLFL